MGLPPSEPSPAITSQLLVAELLSCRINFQNNSASSFRHYRESGNPGPSEAWLLANLEQKRGGLGYGLYGDDPLGFFLLDSLIAHAA